ncbi:MAG: hypothetical protein AAGD92_13995 [Pseudomonadota bacterium]
MTIIRDLAKAVGLIVLAVILFSGIAWALDVNVAGPGASGDGGCIAIPFRGCYFTLI